MKVHGATNENKAAKRRNANRSTAPATSNNLRGGACLLVVPVSTAKTTKPGFCRSQSKPVSAKASMVQQPINIGRHGIVFIVWDITTVAVNQSLHQSKVDGPRARPKRQRLRCKAKASVKRRRGPRASAKVAAITSANSVPKALATKAPGLRQPRTCSHNKNSMCGVVPFAQPGLLATHDIWSSVWNGCTAKGGGTWTCESFKAAGACGGYRQLGDKRGTTHCPAVDQSQSAGRQRPPM
mmetsp:Transcript_47159/g.137148  ORF Transcript_47159/g.137148 Transcript_47159/m.137148 type:complete len:239 (+) Transcript_47159:336-1052(+)